MVFKYDERRMAQRVYEWVLYIYLSKNSRFIVKQFKLLSSASPSSMHTAHKTNRIFLARKNGFYGRFVLLPKLIENETNRDTLTK